MILTAYTHHETQTGFQSNRFILGGPQQKWCSSHRSYPWLFLKSDLSNISFLSCESITVCHNKCKAGCDWPVYVRLCTSTLSDRSSQFLHRKTPTLGRRVGITSLNCQTSSLVVFRVNAQTQSNVLHQAICLYLVPLLQEKM